MEKDPFKEYLRESEPDKAHKKICLEYFFRRWTDSNHLNI